jgi:streptogramin lyase
MTFNPQRSILTAAGGVLLASAVAACTGGPASTMPGGTQRIARSATHADGIPKPGSRSTEFFAGITPNSNPRGIANGPKGDMWFTQPGSNQIAHITAKGVVTEITAPANGVNNIVEGSDGNLWFTQSSADRIGRMTPGGKVKLFKVGNEAYGPFDITTGSDGNLWFSFRSPSTNAIGRITIQGVVTLFTSGLSPGDVAVHDISDGPDGNVWFTEEFGNRIGKITPAGVITEYSNGISANAGLVDITGGPDGNVWFTENSINQVGRITPGGTVTEFSQGISPNAGPGSIASARGSLWMTESNAGNVAQVSTSGSIVEYPIPATLASDIAPAQSNGDLWITDYGGNGIVRFIP